MKKKLPQSLLDKQESERLATASKVTDAIIELQSQGYNIRIKDIMLVTGLSRSVFSKSHIRKILVEYAVVEPCVVDSSSQSGKKKHDVNILLAEKDGYIDRLLLRTNS